MAVQPKQKTIRYHAVVPPQSQTLLIRPLKSKDLVCVNPVMKRLLSP
jgi:hypothetical protein